MSLPNTDRLAELLAICVSSLRDTQGRVTGLRLPLEAYPPLAEALHEIAGADDAHDAIEAARQPRRMSPPRLGGDPHMGAVIRAAGSIACLSSSPPTASTPRWHGARWCCWRLPCSWRAKSERG